MNDNYAHVESNAFYIVENILGPVDQSLEYRQLVNDFNSQLADHCNCDKVCSLYTCKCLQKTCCENYVAHWRNGQQKYKLNKTNTLPIFECNDNCSCPTDCSNRVVQKGPIEGLEIRPSDKGFGLYTTLFVPEGTFVCEYAGELITKPQAAARHQTNSIHGKLNYIFCLKEHSSLNTIEMYVDPSVFGNIGRYINHSCEPNCHVVPVRCDSPMPKLAIFTKNDIQPNEEITFHYGSSDICDSEAAESRIRCLCKSNSCTGFIPFHKY